MLLDQNTAYGELAWKDATAVQKRDPKRYIALDPPKGDLSKSAEGRGQRAKQGTTGILLPSSPQALDKGLLAFCGTYVEQGERNLCQQVVANAALQIRGNPTYSHQRPTPFSQTRSDADHVDAQRRKVNCEAAVACDTETLLTAFAHDSSSPMVVDTAVQEVLDTTLPALHRSCFCDIDVVSLAQSCESLRTAWADTLQERKAEAIDAHADVLLHAKARGAKFDSKQLNFKKSFLTDDELEILCSSAKFCITMASVDDFCINVNEVGDRGLSALARACMLLPFSQLTDFFAIDNHFGDAGLSAFAAAARSGGLPALRRLYLYCNSIGDAGLIALADAIQHQAFAPEGLSSLLVMDNDISDEGVRSLEVPLTNGRLAKMEELGVGQRVSDEGFQLLIDAAMSFQLPDLRELHLQNNVAIRGKPLQQLIAAIQKGDVPRLKQVWLENTGTSSKLRRALLSELESETDRIS
ncbi:unnamed protein product [Symbiodinium sp. CCMP2592]|nr:unnamed protein product [Symbiodinium sp. CCMP2592]